MTQNIFQPDKCYITEALMYNWTRVEEYCQIIGILSEHFASIHDEFDNNNKIQNILKETVCDLAYNLVYKITNSATTNNETPSTTCENTNTNSKQYSQTYQPSIPFATDKVLTNASTPLAITLMKINLSKNFLLDILFESAGLILLLVTIIASYFLLYRPIGLLQSSRLKKRESLSSILNIGSFLNNELVVLTQLNDLAQHQNVNKIIFPDNKEIFYFNIKDIEELGLLEATSRHVVKKCLHKPTRKIMAIKHLQLPLSRFDDNMQQIRFRMLLREIENFQILWKSPEIVDFYGFCLHEGQALICMELMDMSLKDLYIVVHVKYKEKFKEEFIGYVSVNIVDALDFCKKKGVIHRDIKPSDVLVGYNGDIKLCDFGKSRILENSLASTHVGTMAYWPPENFTNSLSKYDIRSDIWSLGITLMEIILGRLPYIDNNLSENAFVLHQKVVETNFKVVINEKVAIDYSEILCKFLDTCTKKFAFRAKIEDLKMSEFYERWKKCVRKEEISKMVSKYKINY